MRSLALLGVLLGGVPCSAQAPRWSAPLPAVEQGGLYHIALTPEVVVRSQADLKDLRVIDDQGGEVPYMLGVANGSGSGEVFVPFAIDRNEVVARKTVVELVVPPDANSGQLFLRVRNADTDKSVRITGSDDGRAWYMVKDQHIAVRGMHKDPPHQVIGISLPNSAYQHLRLEFNDSLSAPVQVLQVGTYERLNEDAAWVEVPSVQWTQQDSSRRSFIHLSAPYGVALEGLSFSVSDTLAFRRNVRVVTWNETQSGRGRKRQTRTVEHVLASFVLTSGMELPLSLAGIRGDSLMLIVENGDDRPLRFKEIKVLQLARHLKVFLSPDNHYHLATGNPGAHVPQYDPSPFHTGDTLAATLIPGPLEDSTASVRSAPLLDPEKHWIWVAVIGLSLGMGLVAYRLLREMG